jgi:hypothetical protein
MTLKTLINKITSQQDSWNPETLEIFNELWKRMEGAETELEIFELRLKKQWTKGSNLYTQKEYDVAVYTYYDIGPMGGLKDY